MVGGKVASSWQDKQRLGLAAELRVMSELLLLGHNPSRLVVQDGCDLLLENGTRIEVKGSHRIGHVQNDTRHTYKYRFSLNDGRAGKRGVDPLKVDFIIGWCVEDDVFYIIPAIELRDITGVGVYATSEEPSKYAKVPSKYRKYREAWELIKSEGG